MTDPAEPMPMRHPALTYAEMRSRRRVIIARNIFVALGVLLLIVTLGVVTYSVIVTRQAQVANMERAKLRNETLDQVKVIARQIRSCTTPEGACSKRGEARGETLAQGINSAQKASAAAAASCAATIPNPSAQRVLACMNRTLSATTP